VRYEGQVPVDGMDANFYSDFNTDSWCTLFLASQLVDNFDSRVDALKSLPVTGDVLTFDDDTIATVQRAESPTLAHDRMVSIVLKPPKSSNVSNYGRTDV
jgi:hypothetical protein